MARPRSGRDEALGGGGGNGGDGPWAAYDWKLAFRQTRPFVFSPSDEWAQAQWHNAQDESKENYSILH